jgi:hypothetical protein
MLLLALLGNIIMIKAQTPVTGVPYNCTFEDAAERSQWTLWARPTAPSKWAIGTSTARSGSYSMYVSKDGIVAEYTDGGSGYYIVAFRTFDLPAGNYDLSFNWKSAQQGTGSPIQPPGDAFRVGWLKASDMPATQTAATSLFGATFPSYVVNNPVSFTNGSTVFYGSAVWQSVIGTVTVPVGTTENYVLAFVWKADGNGVTNPGACIDNVQIAKKAGLNDCFAPPSNLQVGDGSIVAVGSSLQATWNGTATSYDVEYFRNDNPVVFTTSTNTTSFSVPVNIPEGIYSFRFRSICNGDTSIFVERGNILVYDPLAHCLDYLTLTNANCWIGNVSNPYQTHQKVDNGYAANAYNGANNSRQTVHYIPGETDAIVPLLKTKPEGSIASVRIGNANTGSQGEAVQYAYTVPTVNPGILLLKYAAVIQNPENGGNSRMDFELLSANGNQLSLCTTASFTVPNETYTPPGWAVYQSPEAGRVVWKDWTTIGVNLKDYAGQTITIRVTSRDCVGGAHFAYGYFTLDCADGLIESDNESCGIKPQFFTVDEGFAYKWYWKYDPNKTQLGNTNTFTIASSDTMTYCVDMISLVNSNCYFTLEASSLKQLPKARAAFTWQPENCVNKVVIQNNSGVFGYYIPAGSTTEQEVDLHKDCDSYFWDFGEYGTSNVKNPPPIVFPNAGDTIIVKLTAVMSNGNCIDTTYFVLEVPAISTTFSSVDFYIREIDLPYTYNNKTYTEDGNYTDNLTSFAGCDSVLTVNLKVLKTQFEKDSTQICSGSFIVWHNNTIRTTGIYGDTIRSVVLDYDSIVYELKVDVALPVTFNVTVHNSDSGPNTGSLSISGIPVDGYYTINGVVNADTTNLPAGNYTIIVYNQYGCEGVPQTVVITTDCVQMDFEAIQDVCADDPKISIPYTITKGLAHSYSLKFDTEAQSAGFTDVIDKPISPITDMLSYFDVPLPANVRPGNYKVTVKFEDYGCQDIANKTLDFTILYPSSIVAQKWNDVLAVYNQNYNGGYMFSGFRWYYNGVEIPNETGSYYYVGAKGEALDSAGYYQVALQRVGESDYILSCFIETDIHNAYNYSVYPTMVSSGQPVTILFGLKTITVTTYNSMGVPMNVSHYTGGSAQMYMPSQPGIYTVVLIEDETGNRVTERVLVQ